METAIRPIIELPRKTLKPIPLPKPMDLWELREFARLWVGAQRPPEVISASGGVARATYGACQQANSGYTLATG